MGFSSWWCFSPREAPQGLQYLWSRGIGRLSPYAAFTSSGSCITAQARRNWFVLLLLLLSDNIQPDLGPELTQLQMPDEFKTRNGLQFFHLNVRSFVNKIDFIRILADSTDSDIMVFSETWPKKSVTDALIGSEGYSVFRADRARKGGGIAIYTKSKMKLQLHSFSQ